MSALYLVAELRVNEPAKLGEYARDVAPLLARFGGRIVALGRPELLEGATECHVLVVQRWPSRAAFDAFWTSTDYEPLKRLRHEAADSRLLLVDEVPERDVTPRG